MKRKGRRKLVIKPKRTMLRLEARPRTRRPRSVTLANKHLSKQIDIQRVVNSSPIIEVRDGIATNIDYTNPQHLKWLED